MDMVITRQVHKNEMNPVLTNDLSIIKDISVLPKLNFASNHRMCRRRIEVVTGERYRNWKKN